MLFGGEADDHQAMLAGMARAVLRINARERRCDQLDFLNPFG